MTEPLRPPPEGGTPPEPSSSTAGQEDTSRALPRTVEPPDERRRMIAAWETGFEVGRQARRQSAVASFALLVLLFFMGLGVGYIAWH